MLRVAQFICMLIHKFIMFIVFAIVLSRQTHWEVNGHGKTNLGPRGVHLGFPPTLQNRTQNPFSNIDVLNPATLPSDLRRLVAMNL